MPVPLNRPVLTQQDYTSPEMSAWVDRTYAQAEKTYLQWLKAGKGYDQDTFETIEYIEEMWRRAALARSVRDVQIKLKASSNVRTIQEEAQAGA